MYRLLARLNGLLLRYIYFYSGRLLVFRPYAKPLAGYSGCYVLHPSGRPVAFIEEGTRKPFFDWCADNWFAARYKDPLPEPKI